MFSNMKKKKRVHIQAHKHTHIQEHLLTLRSKRHLPIPPPQLLVHAHNMLHDLLYLTICFTQIVHTADISLHSPAFSSMHNPCTHTRTHTQTMSHELKH